MMLGDMMLSVGVAVSAIIILISVADAALASRAVLGPVCSG